MSKNVFSLLIAVCTLFVGACAGRQIHTGMPGPSSFQASKSQARTVDPAATAEVIAPAVQVEEIVAAPAAPLTDSELRAKVQLEIDTYVHDTLAESDASNRAAAERMNQTPLPPTLADNDALVAALNADYEAVRSARVEADRDFQVAVDDILDRAEAREREDRRQMAVASARYRRASAVALASTSAATVPVEASKPEIVPAASAATVPVPDVMPEAAANVASTHMMPSQNAPPETLMPFVPDASVIAQDHERQDTMLKGALVAAVLGFLLAIFLIRRRTREFREQMRTLPYADLPDGTVVVHEIRGGAVYQTNVVMNGAAQKKPAVAHDWTDDEERKFFDQPSTVANAQDDSEPIITIESDLPPAEPEPFAAIVANDSSPPVEATPLPAPNPVIEPTPPPPADAEPDPIAATVAIEPSPPVQVMAPQDPLPEPPPVLAAGTREISSEGRGNHSVDGEIHVIPRDEERIVDKPTHTIIYEERSDEPSKDTTAPSN